MGIEAIARRALKDWLSTGEIYDVFATVTLKQAIRNDDGGLTMLSASEARRTLWILRDRVTKAVLGNRRSRKGERLTFVPFVEGGDGVTRRHFHVCTRVPEGISAQDFMACFRTAAVNLDWVNREIDFRKATELSRANNLRLVEYSLKEGSDAFVPEAASI